MIFSRRKTQKAVIFLSDTQVKYVALSKYAKKYHIEKFEQADLKKGVMKNGEVLEMEFLSQILTRVQKNLNMQHVDVLLPHRYFEHKKVSLNILYTTQHKMKQAFYKHVTQHPDTYSWITTHSFELMFYKTEAGVDVHVQLLTQENYRALVYVFEKAGFTIGSVHSEDFSFNYVFPADKKVLHVRIFGDTTRLSLFEKGVHMHDTDIDFSYAALRQVYRKNGVFDEQMDTMLAKHGFLATYDDQGLYRGMSQFMTALLLSLKTYVMDVDQVQISFESYVIPGFVDILQKSFYTSIQLVNPLHFPKYLFSNVRSIHVKEIPAYTSCLLYLAQKMS